MLLAVGNDTVEQLTCYNLHYAASTRHNWKNSYALSKRWPLHSRKTQNQVIVSTYELLALRNYFLYSGSAFHVHREKQFKPFAYRCNLITVPWSDIVPSPKQVFLKSKQRLKTVFDSIVDLC